MFPRYTKIILSLTILALLLAGLPNYSAKVDVVPHGGNDGRDGGHGRTRGTIIVNQTGSGDYTHIQWAVDNASEGDTVYVEAGVYHEKVIVKTRINLEGEAAARTVIDGDNWRTGLVVKADGCLISDLKVRNGNNDPWRNFQCGIRLKSSNNTVRNCVLTGNDVGIRIETNAFLNRIENNVCNNNDINGISIIYDNETNMNKQVFWVMNNTCNNNDRYGICVARGMDSQIINNTCCYNYHDGIRIVNRSENITLSKNNCSMNRHSLSWYPYGAGIYLMESSNSTIEKNTCNNNSFAGIVLYDRMGNHIGNNVCNDNRNGIEIDIYYYTPSNEIFIDPVEITNNICTSNEQSGISPDSNYAYRNRHYVISNNTCDENNEYGIVCESNSTIFNNTCSLNQMSGIYCFDKNNISNNTCGKNRENGLRICGSNNVIDGNYLHRNNLHGIWLEEEGWGWRICINNTLTKNRCDSNTDSGIYIVDSSENNLSNNTCINHDNGNGIWLYSTHENSMDSNDCNNNNIGILVDTSDNNDVCNNNCENNIDFGIHFSSSSNNQLSSNYFRSNIMGIFLDGSDNNDVWLNIVDANLDYGICTTGDTNRFWNNTLNKNIHPGISMSWDSSNNHVYGNYFFDNNPSGKQASDSGSNNRWYLGNYGN